MDVQQAIDDLRSSLERVVAEDELFGVIVDRLAFLRRAYASQRSLFTPSDIEFLKSVNVISDHLRAFIELREELLTVGSIDEYEDILRRLTHAKNALASFPVGRRVAKEIRELNERLPAIREHDEARRQFRTDARILELQQNPRYCARNHAMVIRKGSHGYFWGCSRYPFCDETAQLSAEEHDLLKA